MVYLWVLFFVIDIFFKGVLYEKYIDYGYVNVEVGILLINIIERWGIYNWCEIVVIDFEENIRCFWLFFYFGLNLEMFVIFVQNCNFSLNY